MMTRTGGYLLVMRWLQGPERKTIVHLVRFACTIARGIQYEVQEKDIAPELHASPGIQLQDTWPNSENSTEEATA